MPFLCIFEIDPETKEATGTVSPFCSETCRTKAGDTAFPGFKASVLGTSHHGDFGYTPHCEECGNEIVEIHTHGWIITCSSNVTAQDIMQYGFRLDGDVLLPDSMDDIRGLLGDDFIVTDVTHPKTESSRGLPARSVLVKRLITVPA